MIKKNDLFIYIPSQQAEAGPPLGTVLGNLGLNTIKFCKEFNEFTQDLPSYFILRVKIVINENRTFSFNVFSPPLSSLINLLRYEREFRINGRKVMQNCISLHDIVQLTSWQFPQYPLQKGIPIILGTIKSFSLVIVK